MFLGGLSPPLGMGIIINVMGMGMITNQLMRMATTIIINYHSNGSNNDNLNNDGNNYYNHNENIYS